MNSKFSSGCDLFSNRNFNRFDPALPIRFFDQADSGGGNGGSNSGGDSGGDENPNNDSNNSGKGSNKGGSVDLAVQAQLIDLTTEHGSVENAAKFLIKRNHSLTESAKKALPKDQKAAFDAISGFMTEKGLTLDQLKAIVSEHGAWSAERIKDDKVKNLKNAAGVAKINGDLLASLDGALIPDYSVVGEGDNAVATVKYKDDKGADQTKNLADWAKEKWPTLEATLFAEPGAQQKQQQRKVTPLGPTPPANSGQKLSTFEQIKERNQAAKENQGKGKSFLDTAREAGMTVSP